MSSISSSLTGSGFNALRKPVVTSRALGFNNTKLGAAQAVPQSRPAGPTGGHCPADTSPATTSVSGKAQKTGFNSTTPQPAEPTPADAYNAFMEQLKKGDKAADVNNDGLVDFTDYLDFMNTYDKPGICPAGPGGNGLSAGARAATTGRASLDLKA